MRAAVVIFCLSVPYGAAALEQAEPSKDSRVMAITIDESEFDPPVKMRYSINSRGRLRFQNTTNKHFPSTVERAIGSNKFNEIAGQLAPFRVPARSRRRLAADCRAWLSDVGSLSVIWTYADGTKSSLLMTNCRDDETKRFIPVLVNVRKLMGIEDLRRAAWREAL